MVYLSLIVLYEISQILNTGLNRQQLEILVQLCEMGVNPEVLANVVNQLRAESNGLGQRRR